MLNSYRDDYLRFRKAFVSEVWRHQIDRDTSFDDARRSVARDWRRHAHEIGRYKARQLLQVAVREEGQFFRVRWKQLDNFQLCEREHERAVLRSMTVMKTARRVIKAQISLIEAKNRLSVTRALMAVFRAALR